MNNPIQTTQRIASQFSTIPSPTLYVKPKNIWFHHLLNPKPESNHTRRSPLLRRE